MRNRVRQCVCVTSGYIFRRRSLSQYCGMLGDDNVCEHQLMATREENAYGNACQLNAQDFDQIVIQ